MIENLITKLTEAIEANTAAIRDTLTAAGAAPAAKPVTPKKKELKPVPPPEPEPEPEPSKSETGDDRPEVAEFEDPVETKKPEIDVAAVEAEIKKVWGGALTKGTAEQKTVLKDAFPGLKSKWGLEGDAKLADLHDRPENLVGLLDDIKELLTAQELL